jgi:hypothetical protein
MLEYRGDVVVLNKLLNSIRFARDVGTGVFSRKAHSSPHGLVSFQNFRFHRHGASGRYRQPK